MRYIFFIFAIAGCLSLAACSDEDEKARLFEGIVKRSALNDSLKKEIRRSEIDKAALETISDSLSKFGDILLEKNNQLNKELEKTKQEASKYRQYNEQLQEKVGQLQEEIVQLEEGKIANEQEMHRLAVTIDSISADREVLKSFNQELENKLKEIREALDAAHQIHISVRLLVGTESLLKSNRFLETSRGKLLRKRYKLVETLESEDPRVKIVPLNQQFPLTLHSIPKALVGRSGRLTLQTLVDRHGKLKEGRDYTVHKNSNTTIITFINRVLEGTGVLAVVEVKD